MRLAPTNLAAILGASTVAFLARGGTREMRDGAKTIGPAICAFLRPLARREPLILP
jgi:hypothetical protein